VIAERNTEPINEPITEAIRTSECGCAIASRILRPSQLSEWGFMAGTAVPARVRQGRDNPRLEED